MIIYLNNSDSLVIVLHEIYGINKHIRKICEYYSLAGFDVICPNLLNTNKIFEYSDEENAYQYFMKNVGFDSAYKKVENILSQVRHQYKRVFILGYSIGATVAWLFNDGNIRCDGIIGYYGSRIRDYSYINPKYETLLIFPDNEKSFNVDDLIFNLNEKSNVNAYKFCSRHGFCDTYSANFDAKSCKKADRLVNNFINNLYQADK